MNSLLPSAKLLAQQPPVKVYQTIMKWYAADIRERNKNDKKFKDPKFEEAWNNQVDMFGEAAATYSVAASCDMTAMCMLMLGAGVQRIEAMKTKIRTAVSNKQAGTVFEDNATGDHAHIYLRDPEADQEPSTLFEALIAAWCKQKGNGILQLKFSGGDAHTFAIERVQEDDKAPLFIVYQAYQNLYRLADFLGVGKVAEQLEQNRLTWRVANGKYKKNAVVVLSTAEEQRMNDFVNKALVRINTTAVRVGGGTPLPQEYLETKIIRPLATMLRAAIPATDYSRFTGCGGGANDNVQVDYLAVLMCDRISPAQYANNYKELSSVPGTLTLYPEIYYGTD